MHAPPVSIPARRDPLRLSASGGVDGGAPSRNPSISLSACSKKSSSGEEKSGNEEVLCEAASCPEASASRGSLLRLFEGARRDCHRVLQRLCLCQEDVDKASDASAGLLAPVPRMSASAADETKNSAPRAEQWEQQRLLTSALQKQIDELRAYADALSRLSESLREAAATAPQGLSFGSLDEADPTEAAHILAVAAALTATSSGEASALQKATPDFARLLEALTDSGGEPSDAHAFAALKARSDATAASMATSFRTLKRRLEETQMQAQRRADFVIRWAELFIDGACEVERHLSEAAPLVAAGSAWEKQIDAALKAQQEQKRELEARLNNARREADQVASRLSEKRQQFLMAIEDWTTERLDQLTKNERMQRLNTRIDALERQLRGLAAFSPLFIVERTPKYVTLQYKPLDSATDYEISIEGLELSLDAQAPRAYKISSFFSVRVTPRLTWLEERLERSIRDYFATACSLQRSASAAEGEDDEARAVAAADPLKARPGLDRAASGGSQPLQTLYDVSPYGVFPRARGGGLADESGDHDASRKKGCNDAAGVQTDASSPGESEWKKTPRDASDRKTRQVKIFSEHIAAIVLKTLTTAFAAGGEGRPARRSRHHPYNFAQKACPAPR
ncbi:hypothetical protein BESB_072240 [Besnoitia besnoiti]|uniref:Uncharacterized protein n=1 Tax=Besnoitia besnoiti TaxID=94643 RepID=A0A2A9MFA8_BESBE|nr:uncharacterized protein BESB_072240 [Besnoitia besnoiti]PFH34072.1 hypothetical protein BESB_072240 [Besnoitia besnoiti]